MTPKPRLAATIGDPAGIGPEIVLKALADEEITGLCRPLVVGDLGHLQRTADACELPVRLQRIDPKGEIEPGAIAVVDLANVDAALELGVVSAAAGEAAWQAIHRGVELCLSGDADALVTAPINKLALQLAGRGHEGHTEILQELTGSPWSLTVFVLDRLRVVFFSRHLSLRAAIDAITTEQLCTVLERFAEAAPSIGLDAPRIAVAALNPHAGEDGLFGDEEIRQIRPAVEAARAHGLDVDGPVPADSVFHLARAGRYDAVLSLYHDQAAAVMKTLDFHRTVSVTLGLPFLRFSVDHGTALDIAGQNIADATNMKNTFRLAAGQVAAAKGAAQR